MTENQKKIKSSAGSDAPRLAEIASRFGGIIFLIIGAMLIFSVVAFGAVDFGALGVLSILAGLISILWLADSWLNKEFRYSSNPLQIPLLALIGIGLIQLLPLRSIDLPAELLPVSAVASLSLAPYATRLATVQLIVYFVFFAAALTFINSQRRLQKIVLTTIVFGSTMAFYGILQRLASLEEIYGLRAVGQASPFASFLNGHHFAAFMEMTIGITLALLFGKATKNNKRIFLIIAGLVMGIAVVFTSSRAGMISLLGVIGFIVAANILQKPAKRRDSSEDANLPITNLNNYRRNFALIGGGIVLILVLFGSVILLGGDESLLRGIGLRNQADVSNGRIHFWQIALRIFGDYPILGAGLDSYGAAFTRYDTWNGAFRVEQAHNDYLQILADAGIAGFACATAFIFFLFKQGLQTVGESIDAFRRNTAIGALAGCCGILIHSFFDFPLRTPSNALFFLILTVLATTPIYQPKIKRKRKSRRLEE